jgi:hypothetical protein
MRATLSETEYELKIPDLTPPANTPTLSLMDQGARQIPPDILEAVHRLVEANRLQCLWFMREDYLPRSVPEADRTLAEIELHGDRQAWSEARHIRAWLSRTTSVAS